MNTKTKTILKSVLVIGAFSIALHSFAAWTAPTATPPGNNTASPINVSYELQSKAGPLVVGAIRSLGAAIFDDTLTTVGSVGIGTTNPGAKLEVNGQVKITGGTPAQNKVLASDNTGLASWKDLSELGGGGGGSNGGWTDDGSIVRLTTLSDNVVIGNNSIIYRSFNNTPTPTNRFLHTSGASGNVFLGITSGNLSSSGGGNTGVGSSALSNLTSGLGNTAMGNSSMSANTTGSNNTAMGVGSMSLNTIGGFNTSVGKSSLSKNTSGNNNTSVGAEAMNNNLSGNHNSALGTFALNGSTGSYNTALGSNSLLNNGFGSNNTAVGYNSGVTASEGENSLSNTTALGNGAIVDASNKVKIGNALVTWIGGAVPWSPASDMRLKKNITDSDLGLDFIKSLRPVSYQMKTDAPTDGLSYGFIAQEVEKALGDKKTKIIETEKTEEAYKYLRYNDIIPILTKAVQEQQQEIELLKQEIELLKNKN